MKDNKNILEQKNNKILLILAIIAGVIILGVAAFFLITGLSKSPGNETMGDNVTSEEGTFSSESEDESDDSNSVQVSSNSSKKTSTAKSSKPKKSSSKTEDTRNSSVPKDTETSNFPELNTSSSKTESAKNSSTFTGASSNASKQSTTSKPSKSEAASSKTESAKNSSTFAGASSNASKQSTTSKPSKPEKASSKTENPSTSSMSTGVSNNSPSQENTSTTVSSKAEGDENTNALEAPTITAAKFVAPDICVVTGSCEKGTESIVISGDKVQQITVVPYAGDKKDYFVTQVQCTGSGYIRAVAQQTGKEPSKQDEKYVTYDIVTGNLMTKDEYRPVIGKNGFGHFYSALVGYSYSTQNLDSNFKTDAKKHIQDIVNAAKAVEAEPIFLIIPSSAEIYPETLPDGYTKTTGESLYKAFYDIAKECGATVIYPIDTMKSHKNDGVGYQLYQHTDSHWSTYGAYWGTYDLFTYISEKFPSAKPRTLSEMGFYTKEFYAGDNMFNLGLDSSKNNPTFKTKSTKMKELSTLYSLEFFADTLRGAYHNLNVPSMYLSDRNSAATVTENPEGNGLPNAVIMRDSFSKVSFDMVSDRFNKVYWQTFDDYALPTSDLAVADADYLIYMYSERNLLKLMLNNKGATILNLK